MKINRFQKILIIAFISFDLLVLESIIKYILINKTSGWGFYLFSGILEIGFYKNTNIAFGLPLPQSLTIVLVILILIMLGFLWWKSLIKSNLWQFFACSIIILGALSNLLDRLLFGYVIDYLNFIIWPVFNLADVMVVVGVGLYIIFELKDDHKKKVLKI